MPTVRALVGLEREVADTRATVDLESALGQERVLEGTAIGLRALNGFDSPQATHIVRANTGRWSAGERCKG